MMENEEKRVWGIHTKDDHLFLVDNRIAIEWKPIGNLSKIEATRAAFKDKYIEVYPNAKKGAIPTSSGMLYRFMYEMQVGDYVVFPFKSDRKINIGIVESDYIYEPTALEYVQQRKVKWIKHLPRTGQGTYFIQSVQLWSAVAYCSPSAVSAAASAASRAWGPFSRTAARRAFWIAGVISTRCNKEASNSGNCLAGNCSAITAARYSA